MEPCCQFCGLHCFQPFPEGTPYFARNCYNVGGRNVTIIATCAEGQAYELEKFGWSYDTIRTYIQTSKPRKGDPHAIQKKS